MISVLWGNWNLNRQFLHLTPVTLTVTQNLPPLLNPRKRPSTSDITHNPQRHLPTHTHTRTIFFSEQGLQIEVQRRQSEIRVSRALQLGQRQERDTSHEPLELDFMLTEERSEVFVGVCDGDEGVRRMGTEQ